MKPPIHQPSHLNIRLPHLNSHLIKPLRPQRIINRDPQRLIRVPFATSIRNNHNTRIANPLSILSGMDMAHTAKADDVVFRDDNEVQARERVGQIGPCGDHFFDGWGSVETSG